MSPPGNETPGSETRALSAVALSSVAGGAGGGHLPLDATMRAPSPLLTVPAPVSEFWSGRTSSRGGIAGAGESGSRPASPPQHPAPRRPGCVPRRRQDAHGDRTERGSRRRSLAALATEPGRTPHYDSTRLGTTRPRSWAFRDRLRWSPSMSSPDTRSYAGSSPPAGPCISRCRSRSVSLRPKRPRNGSNHRPSKPSCRTSRRGPGPDRRPGTPNCRKNPVASPRTRRGFR